MFCQSRLHSFHLGTPFVVLLHEISPRRCNQLFSQRILVRIHPQSRSLHFPLSRWEGANDSDFLGNDIGHVYGGKKEEEGGRSCIGKSTCTHFTYYGHCILKSWAAGSNPPPEAFPFPKGLCGWVKSRVKS